MYRVGLFLTAIALIASPAAARVVDFEVLGPQQYDLFAATEIYPDTIHMLRLSVRLSPYFQSNGNPTSTGNVRVQSAGSAGGSGKKLWINNVNLNFSFNGGPIEELKLSFGEFGGNINLQVNGSQQNAANFQDLPASIGGVVFNVSPTNTPGSMITLAGTINSFSIGGQELAIDNLVYRVPEPASVFLLGLGLIFPIRWRR